MKTKLKHELAFIAYDSAAKNAAALYSYPEHGYLIGCYRELKKLADLTAETDDKDLINTLDRTLGMIDNPTDTSVRKNLLKYLPTKYHKDVSALAL